MVRQAGDHCHARMKIVGAETRRIMHRRLPPKQKQPRASFRWNRDDPNWRHTIVSEVSQNASHIPERDPDSTDALLPNPNAQRVTTKPAKQKVDVEIKV